MLYLIDDSNFDTLNANFVFDKKYKDRLCIVKDEYGLNEIESRLEDADCIMVHKTFNNSNYVAEDIKDITDDGDKIPLVLFSGSDSESVKIDGQSITGIKKNLFYKRLIYFLDEYILTGNIELKILAYGKDFIKRDVSLWAMSLLKKIYGFKECVCSESEDTILSSEELRNIVSVAQPALNISYEQVCENIKNGSCSMETLRLNINNILSSINLYGKNIHSWK